MQRIKMCFGVTAAYKDGHWNSLQRVTMRNVSNCTARGCSAYLNGLGYYLMVSVYENIFQAIGSQMAVRLPASRTGRGLLPRNILCFWY
jgi:hypothetical protein